MEINKRRNIYYNNYSPQIINNNFNKRNFLSKSPLNNFNRIIPSYSGNPQLVKNNSNIYPPNYPSYSEKNTSYNLYELNIPKKNIINNINNNQSNNFSSKYSTSSSSSQYLNNSKNYFSPMPTNSPQIRNLPTPQSPPKFSNFPNYNNGSQKLLNRNNSSPYLNANKSQNFTKRKTLILDLDETLVHSGFNPFRRKSDLTLTINIDGRNHIINVLKRPYVDEFLKEISKYYEIIIFTASIAEYASPLLDKLDRNNYCSKRLFRQDCLFNHGLYIKDLKIIGKDLKDMIIIDNNPVSYAVNEDNGIPILTWYDDLNDNELYKLLPLLKYLSNVDDVRPIIKQIVNRKTNEVDFYLVNKIINNKNYENNIFKNNLYNNNYEPFKNEENVDRNLNENKFRNYLDNNNYYKYNNNINSFSNMSYNEIQNEGHINNTNKLNNYNNFNNYNNYNNYNNNNYNNNNYNNQNDYQRNVEQNNNYYNNRFQKNNDMVNRQKEILFNRPNGRTEYPPQNNNNISPYRYNAENENRNYENRNNGRDINANDENRIKNNRSYTPNINLQRKNSYFNNNNPLLNRYNTPYLNRGKNEEEPMHNIRINRVNNNNFNNRSSSDIFANIKRPDDIKKNNYLNNKNEISKDKTKDKNPNEGLSDYYLESYKKHLLKSRTRFNSYNNKSVIINNEGNNRHIPNPNYKMFEQNNFIKREDNNNNRMNNIRINNNRINNNNIYNNNLDNEMNNYRNNLNNIKNPNINELIINRNNNNNENRFTENVNENRFKENNNNNIYLKRENIIDPNQNKGEKKMYETQNIFTGNNMERNNNYVNYPENYQNSLKNNVIRNSSNYQNNENDNLNRTFSGKKNYLNNNYSPNNNFNINERYMNFINNGQRNENNIKYMNNNNNYNNDSNYINNRTDTEISAYKHKKYIIENEYDKNEEKQNNRSIILNEKRDNFYNINPINRNYNRNDNELNINNNNNIFNEDRYRYLQGLNEREERRFPPITNINNNNYDNNNLYNNYQDNNEFSNIRRNYNNININNYNFYNSLLDDNNRYRYRYQIPNNDNINNNKKINNENENNNNNNNNNNDNNNDIKLMNKSSSYFHPKTFIKSFFHSDEEETKDERNDNINAKNDYIYNYRNNNNNNNFNNTNKNNFANENPESFLPINKNNLLRNQFLYNYNHIENE